MQGETPHPLKQKAMKVKIIGIKALRERIAEYRAMFPKTYTKLGDIKQSLLTDYEKRGGTTELFGIQISPEWEDKCYGFQCVGNGKEFVLYKYFGIWKS